MSPIDSSSSPASRQFAAPPPPQDGEDRACGANLTGKKPAWNVQMNGARNGASVISDGSWPALSQSATGIFKSSLSDATKPIQDQLISAPLGSVMTASQPVPYFPLHDPSSSPSLLKPDAKLNSVNTGDYVCSTGVPAIVTPEPPQLAALEQRTKICLDVVSDSSLKNPPKGKNNWDRNLGGSFAPQNRNTTDHYGRYNGIRRTQNGGRVSHQGGYGKRQDHKLGRYERNLPPHANVLLPPPPGYFRHFIRAPQPAMAPFFHMPVQVRPLVDPMGYPEAPMYFFPPPPPPEKLRNVPFVRHQAPSTIVRPVDNLQLMILKQIEYYFSTENLCKDFFLKTSMDNQGWVPVSLIAGFNRVSITFLLSCSCLLT
ncbi:la-related protein 1C-like [Zingiber officinale]|uniref:la-related protein 1C-like n=1 Tax=Zingiber officinale TaxID=94328 RepID=UPI001C4C0FED|nr:la-related protein 1C-like [Zingiber officinale]